MTTVWPDLPSAIWSNEDELLRQLAGIKEEVKVEKKGKPKTVGATAAGQDFGNQTAVVVMGAEVGPVIPEPSFLFLGSFFPLPR